jgi:hypothetical protein
VTVTIEGGTAPIGVTPVPNPPYGTLDTTGLTGNPPTFTYQAPASGPGTAGSDVLTVVAGPWTSQPFNITVPASGTLDIAFGSNGVEVVSFGTYNIQANALVVDSSGNCIVTGTADGGGTPSAAGIVVARFLESDGSPDTNFASSGVAVYQLSGGGPDDGTGLTLIPGGDIGITGTLGAGGNFSLLLDSNGNEVANGSVAPACYPPGLARVSPAGSLTDFYVASASGTAVSPELYPVPLSTPTPLPVATFTGLSLSNPLVAADASSSLLVVAADPANFTYAVTRYLASNGSLVDTFTLCGGTVAPLATAVAVDSLGNIIVSGGDLGGSQQISFVIGGESNPCGFMLADQNFTPGGFPPSGPYSTFSGNAAVTGLAIQPAFDGSTQGVLISGTVTDSSVPPVTHGYVFRADPSNLYNSDPNIPQYPIDSYTPATTTDFFQAIAVDPRGRIVIAGYATFSSSGPNELILVRFWP